MARFLKKTKEEIGLPPDELIYRGVKKINEVLLRIIHFDANSLAEETIKTVKEVIKYQEKDTVTWFNIDGLHNTDIIEGIANEFNFDRMVLADIMDTQDPQLKNTTIAFTFPSKCCSNSPTRILFM